jgi:hypothetical protein
MNGSNNSIAMEKPTKFSVDNYPNPFNPSTVIRYNLPKAGFVTLRICDVLGKEIATLVDEYKEAGSYNVEFSAEKYNLSSGIYLYALKAGEYYSVRKMLLTK